MILISLCLSQQKIDFRTAEEQAKDPNVALKKSLIFPGVGQLYNDQNIKGYGAYTVVIPLDPSFKSQDWKCFYYESFSFSL